MASASSSKINQLLKIWPSGAVAVLPWLEKQGVYQQLVHEYEKTSWVRRVGRGAYARAGDKVDRLRTSGGRIFKNPPPSPSPASGEGKCEARKGRGDRVTCPYPTTRGTSP